MTKTLLCLGLVSGAMSASALRTPETSSLFIAHTDEVSHVVSYLLRPKLLNFHHQTIYFTSRCMTDDGRFLVFSTSPNEFTTRHSTRNKAIIDFEKDTAYALDGTHGWYTTWIDVERDHMWYFNREGVHFRDLRDDPNKDVLVCPPPEELRYRPNQRYGYGYGTHLTLSPDRRRIFVDVQTCGVYRQGVVNLDTGKWEEWSQTPFLCNHGQFNPVDPHMGMCAFEYAWFLTPDELPDYDEAKTPMTAPPYVTTVRRPRDWIYPRLWLFTDRGEKWMVRSKITNGAGHEIFTWDGKGFYFCSGGTVHHDLATERQSLIVPCRSAHSTMTGDGKYLTFDSIWWGGFRGAGWTTAFWNRDAHRGVFIHSKNPPMASSLADESKLHPDPHPMFVCKDRYIACTKICRDPAGGPTNQNFMALSLTPVAQLVEKTSAVAQPVTPKRVPLDGWRAEWTDGTPCELELDTSRVIAAAGAVATPAISRLGHAYTAYALEATVAGRTVPVPVEPLQHPYRYTDGAVLRFTPPKGATGLTLVVDAPGRFEVRDTELCANLFDRRNLHDLYPAKAAAAYAPGAKPVAAATAEAGAAAGRPVKFELDVRNFARKTWWGNVRLEQFDAAGRSLGDVLETSLDNLEILADRRVQIREKGRLAPAARTVRLFFEGVTDTGLATRIEIQHLNLRPAHTLDAEGRFAAPRAPLPRLVRENLPGVDLSQLDALLADPANRGQPVTRPGAGLSLADDARLTLSDSRTVRMMGRGKPLALDLAGHALTCGGKGRFVWGSLNVKRPGRIVVEDGIDLAIVDGGTHFNGSAANELVCANCGRLQFNSTTGDLGWTLDASGLGCLQVIAGGSRARQPDAAYWDGPVKTGAKRLRVDLRQFGFAFRGPVTGAGLQVTGDAGRPGVLHLLNDGNRFTEGLVAKDAVIRLGCDGALPADGGALVLENATVSLDDAARTCRLPALEVRGSGRVTGGRGAWRKVVKRGTGTLVWDSLSAADELDVREGVVELAFDTSRRTIAGLVESTRIDYPDARVADLWKDIARGRFEPACVRSSPAAYYDGHHPFWCQPPPDTNSAYRGMFAYRGYLWNNAATNVTWSFAGAAGTHLYLTINGKTIIRYTDANSVANANAVLKPGANALEVRGYTFEADRPHGMTSLARPTRLVWLEPEFGLGYDPQGRGSVNQKDYLKLVDPGDGSLLTWTLAEKIVEGVTTPVGGREPIRRQAVFGRINGTVRPLPDGRRIITPAGAVTLDFSQSLGPTPLVYGLARPPRAAYDNWALGPDLREANIPYLYMHNVGGAYGAGAFADISNLFRDFAADENDPASYDFTVTDNLLQQMIRSKLAPIFRLGESEEERADVRRYRTFPPADAAKWARICEHVIRHYNEGWDNGFRYHISYWPIWHAPDRSTCWAGTAEEFVSFYATVARHLKARFPALRIGGAGFSGSVDGFLGEVKRRGLPLDFLSFEADGDPAAVAARLREVKAALVRAGLSGTELLPIVHPSADPASLRCAAEVAANLAMMANEGVRTAVTGEKGAAPHASPFVDPLTGGFRPAFQALALFDKLYAYRERAAFRADDADAGLVVFAVRDEFGAGAVMAVNLSDRDLPLRLEAPGWSAVGASTFDAETAVHDIDVPSTVGPNRTVMVRFRKDGRDEPVPLEKADGFSIDFGTVTGKVKPVHGIGQGPMVGWDFSLFRYLKEAGIPLSRLHDVGGAQGRCVFADVSNIFRDFDADENDWANYDFAFTDLLVGELRRNGVKLYYRLGETIETRSFYRRFKTEPPKDFAKWARICEHIVRHYEKDIAYVEIWNEPEGTENPMYNGLWHGTFEQFLELYGTTARHLKACFPHLKIGGYGSTGFGGAFAGQPSDRHRYLLKSFNAFLDYARRTGCPVDFFSYHCYGDADTNDPIQRFVRRRLDDAGFVKAEIHNTEWKAGWPHGSMRQAAMTAATLVAFQNGPLDAATIYDGRCGPGEYSPLFNPSTLRPHKAYYGFRMFNALYRDGSAVKTAADATRQLRLAASVDGRGGAHALFVNSGKKPAPLPASYPGWRVTGCRALDRDHDDEPIPPPASIAPEQVLLLEFEKTPTANKPLT